MAATRVRSRLPPTRGLPQTAKPPSVLHQTVGARLPAKGPANLTHLYRPRRRFRGQARSYNDGWQPAMCGMPKTVAPINVWVSQAVAPIDVWIHQTVATPPMRGQSNSTPAAQTRGLHQTVGDRSIYGLHRTVGARLPANWSANLTHPYRPYRRFRGQARSYNDGWQPADVWHA